VRAVENIDVDSAISSVKELLDKELDLSHSLKAALEVLILLVSLFLNRTTLFMLMKPAST
jgi:transposase